MNNEAKPGLRIGVTGLSAGTGASTLSKNIARSLELPRIYAGDVRRAFANAWNVRINGDEPTQEDWNLFTRSISSDARETEALIAGWYGKECLDETLEKFNKAHKSFQPESENDPFENVPDVYMLRKFKKESVVLDGKLAVIVDKIEPRDATQKNLVQLMSSMPTLVIPFIRVTLSTDPRLAAIRTLERDNKEQSEENISERIQSVKNRIDYDWQRYGSVYNDKRTGKPVNESSVLNLENPQIHLDTSTDSPEHILIKLLNEITFYLETGQTEEHEHWHSKTREALKQVKS